MMRMGIPTVTASMFFPPSIAGLLDSRVYGVSPSNRQTLLDTTQSAVLLDKDVALSFGQPDLFVPRILHVEKIGS